MSYALTLKNNEEVLLDSNIVSGDISSSFLWKSKFSVANSSMFENYWYTDSSFSTNQGTFWVAKTDTNLIRVIITLDGKARVINDYSDWSNESENELSVFWQSSTNTIEISVNGVIQTTLNSYSSFNFSPVASLSNVGVDKTLFTVYSIEIEKNGVSFANYDPSASNGTGLILYDTVGGNNGTLTNYINDDSQWVFYSDGISSDISFSVEELTFNSVFSTTLPKPISEISYSIDEPVFSSSLSTTLPQPNSTASFVIDKIGIESTSSVTLPSTQSTIDFSEKGLVFNSSVSISLPSVSSDIGFTINENTFSSDVDVTLPSPESSVGFSISKPSLDSSLSVTTPIDIIISDVSFSIEGVGFTASTTVTTPKPISSVSFEVGSQLFNSSIVASTPNPISDINFNISKLELDSDVSITSPIPVSDISFTLSEPTFNAVCVVNGLVLSYLPDAITKVRYSNNITKVTVGNNITMIR